MILSPAGEPRISVFNGATLTIGLANAIPLAGVLFFQWQLLELVRLFICELAVLVAWQGLRMLVQGPKEKRGDYFNGFAMGEFFIVCIGIAVLNQAFGRQALAELPSLTSPLTLLVVVHGARTLRTWLHAPQAATEMLELESAALVVRCAVSTMALIAMSTLIVVADAATGGFILLVLVKTLVEIVAQSFGQYERRLRQAPRSPSGNKPQED